MWARAGKKAAVLRDRKSGLKEPKLEGVTDQPWLESTLGPREAYERLRASPQAERSRPWLEHSSRSAHTTVLDAVHERQPRW